MRVSGFVAGTALLLAAPLSTFAWTPGSQTYANPGTYTFTVPANAGDITVEVWGAGGGGQGCGVPIAWTPACQGGGSGGNSSFANVIAYGGHGSGANVTSTGNHSGGSASGGDINQTGQAGNWNGTNCSGRGGSSPNGGGPDAGFPGGGGDGFCFGWGADGGGGGGYAKKTYTNGQLKAGSTITVVVGAGGAGSAAQPLGAGGEVKIAWTGQAETASFTQSTNATQNPNVGSTDTISTTIHNNGGAANALIDIEVYQNGTRVGQKVFDNQSFNTNDSHTYTFPFTVPSAGTYTVSIGVFNTGWAGLVTWFSNVASFTASNGGGNPGLMIYHDSLVSGWDNWSWGTTVNPSEASLVFSGTFAMKVTYNSPWAGFFLHNNAGVNTSGKSMLTFAIAGAGAGGQQLQIFTYDAGNTQSTPKNLSAYVQGGSIVANTWKQVSIPLADIGASNKTISGIVIQDVSGTSGAMVDIDEMQIQ